MNNLHVSRRKMLAGLTATGVLAKFGWMNALAQSVPADYKALVCIFLFGGNDGHNTIIPLTQSEFNAYKAARGSLALPDGNGAILPVESTDGTPYAFNPGLAAIHPLWAQGKLAALANVGTLVQPVFRNEYLTNQVAVPTNLFSHSDQIQQMQSGFPSTTGGSGWGGRAVDKLNGLNAGSSFPAAISISGPSLFCSGKVVQSASLLPGFNLDIAGMNLWPQSAAAARKTGLQEVIQLNSGMALVQAANKVKQDALDLNALLSGNSAQVTTLFPGTSLGNQLRQVAQILKLRNTTGMSRQVFLCSMSGFDTHSSQSWQHWDLLKDVSEAMAAFYAATEELAIPDKVTTFTLSDFGRTLQPSGSGCDHGWGNHHLIMGGAVQGGKMYGAFPTMALGGPNDSGSRGAMIPTTSTAQYGSTLASWLGVPDDQLVSVFPNIGNFTTPNLGFMG
jgi:uncharacterized protein (DUF1501 family)